MTEQLWLHIAIGVCIGILSSKLIQHLYDELIIKLVLKLFPHDLLRELLSRRGIDGK